MVPELSKDSWLVRIEDQATAELARRKFELLWEVSKKIAK
jgi:hypothetical protein